MANKRKNAAALFEVIRKPEDQAAAPRGSRPSPFGFLKRFNKPTSPVEIPAIDPTPAPRTMTRQRVPHTSTWASDVVGKVGGLAGVAFDRRQSEVTFRLSYAATGLAIFSLCIAMVLAYVIGQRSSSNAVAALSAASTDKIRQQQARPDVTQFNNAGGVAVVPAIDTGATATATSTALPAAADGKRVVGLNYVVVQSYADKADADAAADVLRQAGIACTVEKGLSGWAQPSWYSVVGLTGFERLRSSREFLAYEQKIKAVSDQFAKNSRFKAFDPRAYKWKAN